MSVVCTVIALLHLVTLLTLVMTQNNSMNIFHKLGIWTDQGEHHQDVFNKIIKIFS